MCQIKAAGEADQSRQSAFSGRSTRGAGARGGACEGNVYVGDVEKGGGGEEVARDREKGGREGGVATAVEGLGKGIRYSDSGKEEPRVPKGKFKPNLAKAKYGKNRGGGAAGRGGGAAKGFTDSDAAVLEGGGVAGSGGKEELVGGGPGVSP